MATDPYRSSILTDIKYKGSRMSWQQFLKWGMFLCAIGTVASIIVIGSWAMIRWIKSPTQSERCVESSTVIGRPEGVPSSTSCPVGHMITSPIPGSNDLSLVRCVCGPVDHP